MLSSFIKAIFRSKKQFQEMTGFHGDQYLLQLADLMLRNSKYFIETGTNIGNTLAYVAHKYPGVQCLSCEPSKKSYKLASRTIAANRNVKIFNELSQEFLKRLATEYNSLFTEEVVFWLDAHGYGFEWPLKEEVQFITSYFKRAYILIDDFKVPGEEQFKWDEYRGQVCSFSFIKDSLNKGHDYSLYYPSYKDKTSTFHPLTGWALIVYGQEREFVLPAELEGKVKLGFKGRV